MDEEKYNRSYGAESISSLLYNAKNKTTYIFISYCSGIRIVLLSLLEIPYMPLDPLVIIVSSL
jgi:hypothetical protein